MEKQWEIESAKRDDYIMEETLGPNVEDIEEEELRHTLTSFLA